MWCWKLDSPVLKYHVICRAASMSFGSFTHDSSTYLCDGKDQGENKQGCKFGKRLPWSLSKAFYTTVGSGLTHVQRHRRQMQNPVTSNTNKQPATCKHPCKNSDTFFAAGSRRGQLWPCWMMWHSLKYLLKSLPFALWKSLLDSYQGIDLDGRRGCSLLFLGLDVSMAKNRSGPVETRATPEALNRSQTVDTPKESSLKMLTTKVCLLFTSLWSATYLHFLQPIAFSLSGNMPASWGLNIQVFDQLQSSKNSQACSAHFAPSSMSKNYIRATPITKSQENRQWSVRLCCSISAQNSKGPEFSRSFWTWPETWLSFYPQ